MIFKPVLVGRILAGEKTMTRRPVKDGERVCRYRVGQTYALQSGRGKKALPVRLKVTAVRQEGLHEISDDDAVREGFKDRAEFLTYWWELYRNGPGTPGDACYPIVILVWVISFEINVEEAARLLGRSVGYTERPQFALPHGDSRDAADGDDPGNTGLPHPSLANSEPEAVDDDTLGRFAMDSEQDKVRRLKDYERLQARRPLQDRLAELIASAESCGADISRPLAAIAKSIEAGERKLRADEAA